MRHSVELTEVRKQGEFVQRLGQFDPHRARFENKKREADMDRKLQTVQRLLAQVVTIIQIKEIQIQEPVKS